MEEFVEKTTISEEQLIIERTVGDQEAVATVINFDSVITPGSNFEFKPFFISKLTEEKNVGLPVKIIGNIRMISDAFPITITNGRLSAAELVISDLEGMEIRCLTSLNSKIQKLRDDFSWGKTYSFKGCLISVSSQKTSGYYFYLKEFTDEISPLDLENIGDDETDKILKRINEIKSDGKSIREFIKNELVHELKIKGLDKAPELDSCLDYSIIQSVSHGLSANGIYSNKLHSLIIGPPASGKKLISRAVSYLNRGKKVSSTNSKITPAGLIGRVSRRNGYVTSEPGIIPISNGGAVCFEDFHEAMRYKNEISSILSAVMEDGKVEDSTSAMKTHLSATAIHVDMNRLSQVLPESRQSKFSDLSIPVNILSRFDFIVEIPPNAERQKEIVLDMARGEKFLSTEMNLQESKSNQKEIRKIIALLKSEFKTVKISADVSDFIEKKLTKIFDDNEKYAFLQQHFPSMLTRLEISIEKMAKSIAALEMRDHVIIDDIDLVFEFIHRKLNFLSKLEIMEIDNTSQKTDEKRRNMIIKEFSGKEITLEDASELLQKDEYERPNERTIRRDLEYLCKEGFASKPSRGIWKIKDVNLSK